MKEFISRKATKIRLLDFKSLPMRTFHITWFSFFICFFGWFGIAPLMAVVREELQLTKEQIGSTIIASVAITVLARLAIGWLCDRIGPRITYTYLLILGAIPVMCIGLSNSFEAFLLFRLVIGVTGASFVITQYHASAMFAPNVVGTANATTAGWGNLGGGVTQMIMPLLFSGFIALGFSDNLSWRYAMILPGIVMIVMGIIYYRYTKDTPEGNFKTLKKEKDIEASASKTSHKRENTFLLAVKDIRVWALFLIYGACFGIELTINNIGAIYYKDLFDLDLKTAGLIAGLFGLMNLFARSLGGYFGDKSGIKWGLKGRILFLFTVLLLEGITLMAFSQIRMLPMAIVVMVLFSLCVQMAEGATFSIVPFIHKKAVGAVSGIVGAGGNVGAVLAGFLFRSEGISYSYALLILGICVTVISLFSFLVRFSEKEEKIARREIKASLETLLPVKN
ncbi:NarK family nitrate/nitrite MFS transporter [Sinomicrobium weinanense]|uniref:Nitrate/nitrite transporter n=1 Tax=Sinomicrobium weinanense TaxID=2842200 RepID=A0A926JQJ0_9FLAO|nr:NarK family nitrate/nitrite MFS transporter [Sinomicrobium weinanense]MBC9795529.1 NarK family nitrate/nitrite MFS transporter [Sinomicrobium weinanense]MBU3123324.1 NarK family nitrate/nitrite MFS transporter [Sinomicrobium weinanense]